jgi:predicted transcriptional regulator
MGSVWKLSEATVKQVQEHLADAKPMAYNTVLTVMRILRRKGFLQSRRDGRQDVYRALVGREEVGRHSLRDLLERFYAGSASVLVSHLLESEALSANEIRRIRREVDARLKAKTSA